MSAALDGIRILDLSTVVMGPWASQMLADMGADVIKVESPQGDVTRQMGPARNAGMAAVFLCINRNKRSIVLDLQQPAGREALLKLAREADVLLHNLRPSAAEKLGITYDVFEKENPKLIYCAAYGFRKDGPLANKPAYDDVIQAASGLSDLVSAISDQPRFVPSIVADKTTAYAVVSGILGALFQRTRTGRGQALEVSMFETLVDFVMVEHLYGATFDPPIGGMGYSRILTKERRPYLTSDRRYLTVLPYTDRNWRDFFRIAGREQLASSPDFASLSARVKNAGKLYALVAEIVAERTCAEWERDLDAAQIPVMPVRSLEELLADEQLSAGGFWEKYEHPTEGLLRSSTPPIRFSDTAYALRRHPPQLGEHSEELLLEAGYDREQVRDLIEAGVSRRAREG